MRMVRWGGSVWILHSRPSHITIIVPGSNDFGRLLLSDRAHLSGHIDSFGVCLRTVSRVNRTVKIGFGYARALQNIIVSLLSLVHVNSDICSIFRTIVLASILRSMLSYMTVRFHMLLVVRHHIRFLEDHRFWNITTWILKAVVSKTILSLKYVCCSLRLLFLRLLLLGGDRIK